MNLYDVITLQKQTSIDIPVEQLAEYEQWRDSIISGVKFLELMQINKDFTDTAYREILKQTGNVLTEKTQKLVKEHFLNTLCVPQNIDPTPFWGIKYSMSSEPNKTEICRDNSRHSETAYIINAIQNMSKCPKATLKDLVALADATGMIIVPYAYLNPNSYKTESYSLQNQLKNFNRSSQLAGLETYVICPISHYSVLHHICSDNPNRQIIGNRYQQQFNVLEMMMPAMLMLSDRITVNEKDINMLIKKINSMDTSMQGLIRSVEAMDRQLRNLQDKIEREYVNNIAVSFPEFTYRAESDDCNGDNLLFPYDPLIFATTKNPNFQSSKKAIIGPCWGSEFSKDIAKVFALKVKAGQRKKIAEIMNELF